MRTLELIADFLKVKSTIVLASILALVFDMEVFKTNTSFLAIY